MIQNYSKVKTSFYRKILVAYLISVGTNSVPLLLEVTSMCGRTLQKILRTLPEIDIVIGCEGGVKTRTYSIQSWGMISKKDVEINMKHIINVLQESDIEINAEHIYRVLQESKVNLASELK